MTLLRNGLIVFFTLMAVALNGCGQKMQATQTKSATATAAPTEVTIVASAAFDLSGSVNDEQKRIYLGPIVELCDRGLRGSKLTMYAFANIPKLLGTYEVEDSDSTLPVLATRIREVRPYPGRTRYAPTLRRLQSDAKAAAPNPFVAFLMTDGQMFDVKETKQEIKALAKLSNLRAFYLGPITWEPLKCRDIFSPLGKRLVFATSDDQLRSIQDMQQLLKSTKQEGK